VEVDTAAFAEEAFRLTNAERQNAGLTPFSHASSLATVAKARAKETIVLFSHKRPDGQSCFTLYDDYGVVYTRAAENIAFGQSTPSDVVSSWMKSPSHKANILNPNLNLIGIGIAIDKNGLLYWVQSFTD
jgi:uncharacterized protein YkwD